MLNVIFVIVYLISLYICAKETYNQRDSAESKVIGKTDYLLSNIIMTVVPIMNTIWVFVIVSERQQNRKDL